MDELLAAIAKMLGWTNREEALRVFHEKAQPLAQHFIDMGHGIERQKSKDAIEVADKARIKAEGDLVAAGQTIETLKKDKPDIAAMQKANQEALADQQKEHNKEMGKQKALTKSVLLERDLGKIRNRLVEEFQVSPKIADLLTHKNEDLKGRLDHDDKGSPTVFKAGTRTPYTVAQGQEWFHPIAEELKGEVPEGGFVVEGDEGTGASGHGTQSGGGGDKGKGKNVFDNIRSQTEAQVKTKTGAGTAEVRSKKLRGSAPAR